jgi:hypothetical protein
LKVSHNERRHVVKSVGRSSLREGYPSVARFVGKKVPSNEVSQPAKKSIMVELFVTFLAGCMVYFALGLLVDQEDSAAEKAPTVYGVF